jgi:NADH-quinone oxidoreductase subunit J
VLLIFGVMLTARGPFVSMKISSGQWVVAIVIGGALLAVLLQTALNFSPPAQSPAPEDPSAVAAAPPTLLPWPPDRKPPDSPPVTKPSATEQLGFSLLGTPVDRPQPQEYVIGGYLLAFEIISIHLVVVLVGAAYLARAKRRVQRQPTQTEISPY